MADRPERVGTGPNRAGLARRKAVLREVNITYTPGANFAWQGAKHGDPAWWQLLAGDVIFASRWHRVKVHPNGCWFLQMAPGNQAGHILLRVGGRAVYAHRHAYRLAYGEIPTGAVVRHRCDDPACLNPAHLLLGTQRQNVDDCVVRGRRRAWGRQRLQWADVVAIRDRFAAGESQRAIAASYGVSKGCIHAVVRGKAWQRVPHNASQSARLRLAGQGKGGFR